MVQAEKKKRLQNEVEHTVFVNIFLNSDNKSYLRSALDSQSESLEDLQTRSGQTDKILQQLKALSYNGIIKIYNKSARSSK